MKTATFFALVLALTATAAYSQSPSASANAATRATGSVETMGHDATVSQATQASANAIQPSNVSAELAHKIDSKNAKVGDEVVAKTTATAQLQGTTLPKGTRLMGKVTEVQAKSHDQHDGRLAFTFDRAVLREGQEIPIHATLRSISAPASVAAMGDATDDFAATGGPVMASSGGSAHAGGGLLGGGGGAIAHTGGLVSGATSSLGNTSGRLAGTADGTLRTGAGVVSQTGISAMATVHDLPGISATASASGGAMLQGTGRDVQLSGGTQLILGVSAH
jgi:hypothetical protein